MLFTGDIKEIAEKEILKNEEVNAYIKKGNANLDVLGFTDHSQAHSGLVAERAADILEKAEDFSDIEKVLLIADAGIKRLETEHFLYSVKQHSFLVDFDYDLYLFPKKSVAGNWSPGFMEDLLVPALKQETSECCYFYNLHNIY